METGDIKIGIANLIRESRNHPGASLEDVAKAIAINLDVSDIEVLVRFLKERMEERLNKIDIGEEMVVLTARGLEKRNEKENHYLKVRHADCFKCKVQGSLEVVVSGFVNSRRKERIGSEKIAGFHCLSCDYQKKIGVD